jgi:hypothetical protein
MLLAILTLGIYTLFWTYWTHEEIKSRSGEGVGGVIGLVIWVIFSPATFFLVPSEVKTLYQREGETSPVRWVLGLWVVIPSAGTIAASAAWATGLSTLLFLFIFVGMIIWFAGVQNALNRFWSSRVVAPAAVDEPLAG